MSPICFVHILSPFMALNGLFCADVPLRNYSLTHSLTHSLYILIIIIIILFLIKKLTNATYDKIYMLQSL